MIPALPILAKLMKYQGVLDRNAELELLMDMLTY